MAKHNEVAASSDTVGTSSFYAWVIVAVSFILQGVGSGSPYIIGVFIQPLMDLLHLPSAAVLAATTVALSVSVGMAAPGVGAVLQKFPLRTAVAIGLGAVSLGYLGLAYATALWQIALLHVFCFGTGLLLTMLAGNALVANWFGVRNGLAFGIANAGISASGFLLPPLIVPALAQIGLQDTCLIMGAAIGCLMPMVWYFTVDHPNRDSSKNFSQHAESEPEQWTYRKLMRYRHFWLIASITGITEAVASTLLVNLMQIAQEAGITRHDAAYLISYASVSMFVGSLCAGRLFDSISQRAITMTTIAICVLPCLILIDTATPAVLIVASVLIGSAMGITILLPNVLVARHFGSDSFSAVLGAINPAIPISLFLILPTFGWAYDTRGDYDLALAGFVGLLAATALVTWSKYK